jgi:hypothetical protein
MTIACPACRAENSDRICRRCRADLGLLWDLEIERQRLMADAGDALRRCDWARVIDLSENVRQLRDGPDAARLIACAYLIRGKFYRALEWHARAKEMR